MTKKRKKHGWLVHCLMEEKAFSIQMVYKCETLPKPVKRVWEKATELDDSVIAKLYIYKRKKDAVKAAGGMKHLNCISRLDWEEDK